MTAPALITIGLSNAFVAALLALIAFAAGRLARNAPLAHFLWALVVLKLLTPPLFEVRLPIAAGFLGSPARDGAERPVEVSSQDVVPGSEANRPLALLPQSPALFPAPEDTPDPASRAERAAAVPPAGAPAEYSELPLAEAPPSPVKTAGGPPATGPAPRPVPGSEPLRPGRLLAAVWLGGSLSWFALALSRLLRFRRLLRRARPAPAALVEEVRLVARRLGLKQAPEVAVLASRVSPLVWAFGRRARLVLPGELASSLTGPERQTLIAHELAHLCRRDHWLRWVEMLAFGLYWWFPILWWARRELRAAEEECCDGWVQWAFPDERRAYATTLFRTVDFLSSGPAALPDGASGMGQASLLERRFRMILHGRLTRRLPGPQRAALVSFAALVLPWAAGFAAEDEPEDAGPETATEPDASAPAADEIRLQLEWDAGTGTLVSRAGNQLATNVADLFPGILKAKEDHEKVLLSHPALKLGEKEFTVRIEAAAEVPWRKVVEVMDLLKKEGLERVEFAEPEDRADPFSMRTEREYRVLVKNDPGRRYWVHVRNNEVTLKDGNRILWKTVREVDPRTAKVDLDEQGNRLIVRAPDKTTAFDLATGKVMSQEAPSRTPGDATSPLDPAGNPAAGDGLPGLPPPGGAASPWRGRTSRNAPAANLHAPGALPGSPLDVVQLANALVEARGAARLAKNKLQSMADAAKAGVYAQSELTADQIQLDTAEKKIDLLRRMATSALKGTRVEMAGLREIEEMAKRRYESGQATEEAVLAVRMRLGHAETLANLLEDILNE